MKHIIILIGFKACGKSTIGKALARTLDYQWIDTDRDIETRYFNKHHKKLSCQSIAHIHNIDYFKTLESITFQRLHPANKSIISTGGSSFYQTNNHIYLPEKSQVIYLKSDAHTLTERWKHHPPPWLIEDIDHPLTQQALHHRDQCYTALADYIIHTAHYSIEIICDNILKKITP